MEFGFVIIMRIGLINVTLRDCFKATDLRTDKGGKTVYVGISDFFSYIFLLTDENLVLIRLCL